ncbi:uncharacterized protein LOC132610158 [Lycium barbarum]|uniref:uncharacterized protein LOC132610158 n=1 Tax=Lycium barbarum TaxID=112863 RepID=UPI00293EEB95|nr:uncharacterized protein LOC132610158 [Lycium barbarum]
MGKENFHQSKKHKYPIKTLASGKVVGNVPRWNFKKDSRRKEADNKGTKKAVNNPEHAIVRVQTHNKFDALNNEGVEENNEEQNNNNAINEEQNNNNAVTSTSSAHNQIITKEKCVANKCIDDKGTSSKPWLEAGKKWGDRIEEVEGTESRNDSNTTANQDGRGENENDLEREILDDATEQESQDKRLEYNNNEKQEVSSCASITNGEELSTRESKARHIQKNENMEEEPPDDTTLQQSNKEDSTTEKLDDEAVKVVQSSQRRGDNCIQKENNLVESIEIEEFNIGLKHHIINKRGDEAHNHLVDHVEHQMNVESSRKLESTSAASKKAKSHSHSEVVVKTVPEKQEISQEKVKMENNQSKAVLQDIVAHKVTKEELQKFSEEIQQSEEDNEINGKSNNFHKVAREEDISPRALAISGKRSKNHEALQTKRLLPKRTASAKNK